MPKVRVDSLRIHPFNKKIFGTPDDGLRESLEIYGLERPIEIDRDSQILSGARRWTAAKSLGWDRIDAEVFDMTEDEAKRHIILENVYRGELSQQIQLNMAEELHDLLVARAVTKEEVQALARQQDRSKAIGVPDNTPHYLAAAAVGMDHSAYSDARALTRPDGLEKKIKNHEKNGNLSKQQAEKLKASLREKRKAFRDGTGGSYAVRKIQKDLKDELAPPEVTAANTMATIAESVVAKGRAFLHGLDKLSTDKNIDYLNPTHAVRLASLVYEAKETLIEISNRSGIKQISTPDMAKKYAEALEVEYETV